MGAAYPRAAPVNHEAHDRALLDLLRTCESTSDIAPLPVLPGPDWLHVARRAIRLGVAPLLLARIIAADFPPLEIPGEARQLLSECHLRNALRNMRLYARLADVLRAFAHDGIAAIVLKGAFLARNVYADPALRSMGDVDLLVQRSALARSERTLVQMGFAPDTRPSWAEQTASGHELYPFELDDLIVEVHWAIEDDESPFAINTEGLWQRARALEISGVPALALAPEDLLLHLCLHASYNHGWLPFGNGLRPFCDIAATIKHYGSGFGWHDFVSRARSWGTGNGVWLSLAVASDLIGAQVPGPVLAQLAPIRHGGEWRTLACELAFGTHYDDMIEILPALGPVWLTKQWPHLSTAARLLAQLLPGRRALSTAYPSLAARPAPLAHLARWKDLLADCLRLMPPRRPTAYALVRREQSRLALLGWLESSGPN